MVTIEINERTKAGKALLAAARIMAQTNEGIEINMENSVLIAKMKRNHQKQNLSETEKVNFLEELQNEIWSWKSIAKDYRKIKSRDLAIAISETILQVSEASTKQEIVNLKKLTGYRSAYRIRIGDYRIGIIIEKSIVNFVAFAHRKEISKRFP